MIGLLFAFRRLANLSLKECQAYWLQNHAQLVRHHAAAVGMLRYTQLHTIDDPVNDALRTSRGTMEPYDGVAQNWWRKPEDLIRAFASPEAQRADQDLLQDEQRFVDASRSSLWLAREHVVINGAPGVLGAERESPIIKLVFAFRKLPKLSLEECQTYWRENHGSLVRRHAAALQILRYVQLHTVEDPINDALKTSRGTMEAFDGVAEVTWRGGEALDTVFTAREAQRAGEELLEDERRFIDFPRSSLWLAKEHVIIEG